MPISGPGYPGAPLEGEPVFLNPTPVIEAPAPAPADLGPFGPKSVSPASYGGFLYRPLPVYSVMFDPYAPGFHPLGFHPPGFHPMGLHPPVPPYGPPIIDSPLPASEFFVPASPLMASSFSGEPGDIPESKSRECLVAYRKYMNWLHTVYYSSNSPHAFVHAWKQALQEMRETFGHPQIPTIFVLNQFLAAVSVNPNTVPWIESLMFEKGSLPASILEEAFEDFLEFEAHRLGNQISSLGSLDTVVANMNQVECFPKQYCPFHQRFTRHPVDECFRNPQNTKRKRKWRRKQARMAAALEAEKQRLSSLQAD